MARASLRTGEAGRSELKAGVPNRTILAVLIALSLSFVAGACGLLAGEEISEDERATFTVDGTTATMIGVIDSSTPDRVRALLADNPDLATIVMVEVPGSVDDEANLEASRLIRNASLGTHATADSVLASGGVDFFLAGAIRTYEPGAQFGVHSWATGSGVEGIDVPRNDPEHTRYLDYYAEMGIEADFYWFTLEAAPADDIYWMTEEELTRYGFAN